MQARYQFKRNDVGVFFKTKNFQFTYGENFEKFFHELIHKSENVDSNQAKNSK